MDTVLDLTDTDFATSVADGITVERAAQLRPHHRFAKVDVDAQPAISAGFGIRSIPTLMVLRDGRPIAAQAGVIGADQLVESVDRLAAETESEAA